MRDPQIRDDENALPDGIIVWSCAGLLCWLVLARVIEVWPW